MKFSLAFVTLIAAAVSLGSPLDADAAGAIEKRAVSTTIYNDLVYYFKCLHSTTPSTDSLTFVDNRCVLNDVATDTQGFIVRDDTKKEIVVVLRGSTSATDFLTDASITLVSFTSPGVSAPSGTLVHTGFLTAWNAIASTVISTVKSQLATYPGYSIATSGHSLGGALSSLAGIALKQNFPSTSLRLFTYGQPRTGNQAYATFVNSAVGVSNIYRGVHTTDGVPTIIPTYYNYYHHATEYWQTIDPSSATNVRQCASSGEDLTCSASIPSGGINAAHLTYYDIYASTAFCS